MMQLPDSYLQKFSAVPEYFNAIHNAQPPERFTYKFMENLGFTSTNDRLFIGVLKSLGFLDADGTPTALYYEFLDGEKSRKVVAKAIRESYAGLFSVNKSAYKMSAEEVKNKLRTLYAGSKSDTVIERVSKTFVELCDYADFSGDEVAEKPRGDSDNQNKDPSKQNSEETANDDKTRKNTPVDPVFNPQRKGVSMSALQYHINIVLPESRDQNVYDAIFRSLRDHLG